MTAIRDFSGTPKETSLRICLPPSTVTVKCRAEKETSPVSTNSSNRSPTSRNVEWPTPTMSFGPSSAEPPLAIGWPLTYVPLCEPRSRISKRPSGVAWNSAWWRETWRSETTNSFSSARPIRITRPSENWWNVVGLRSP